MVQIAEAVEVLVTRTGICSETAILRLTLEFIPLCEKHHL